MESTKTTVMKQFSPEAAYMDKYIDKGFSKRAKKSVTSHAVCGGIVLALPAFGLDSIVYMIILWHMYSALSGMARESFKSSRTKNFIGAFIVNIIVTIGIDLVLSFLPVLGWIGAFFVGYLSLKVSGAAYLSALELLYQGEVRERYSYSNIVK